MNYNTYKHLPTLIIFSNWLWIWAILFFLKITTLSPLPSLIIAVLFVFNAVFILNRFKNEKFKWIVSITESVFLFLVIYTRFSISKRDIIANIGLFIIYNIFLLAMGTNIYEIYFIFMPRSAKENSSNYYNYVLKKTQPTISIILISFILKYLIHSKKINVKLPII